MIVARPTSTTVDALVIGGGATGAGLLRDLARRGLSTLLVEKSDLGTGTSGRYHGLLHSGGRYVVTDPVAAHECIVENRIVRRIAPACVEDTGGYFVATPEDDPDYAEGFAAACAASGVPCDEVAVASLRAREPALSPAIRRAFRVPDAVVEPWQLIEANVADARDRGGDAWPYHRVVSMDRSGGRILGVDVVDVRSGSLTTIHPRIVVSATGAWAGMVAALAGVELAMAPGKGTMLIFNQRMTDTVVNRLKRPGDGDIMVPVHSVAILGTTEEEVDDPDVYRIRREEVAQLLDEGTKLFPDLPRMRLLRAYAGVRPLYREEPPEQSGGGEDGRAISRAHVVIDHEPRDGVDNLVSIVGGKLTTYRLMAKQTADVVVRKLGLTAPCTTAEDVLPNQGDGRTYWLGHRLAEHEAAGGGDADLICECELVTRRALDAFLDVRWPCDLDDVRRGTRLGMGPCQGGFCTFRAAGVVAERAVASDTALTPGSLDAALQEFLAERFRGDQPVAWGRQLQELWLTTGLYAGVLGLESCLTTGPMSSADVVVVGAGLAGMTAAIGLAEAGASVEVVARGHAATHWTAGGLDVAAPAGAATPGEGVELLQAERGHPYAVLGADVPAAIERFRAMVAEGGLEYVGDASSPIRAIPTSIGGTRPAAILPGAQAAALAPWSTGERLVICGFTRFKDFWPDHVASSLTRAAVWGSRTAEDGARPTRVESLSVELPGLAGRRNLSALDVARLFDDAVSRRQAIDTIAGALGRTGSRPGRVGLPAAIGLAEHDVAFRELAAAIGLVPFEIPLVPPSIPGLRLFAALRAALRARGGRIVIGEPVAEVTRDGRRVTAVSMTAAARRRTIRTGAVVLATGGIAGGGLVGTRDGRLVEAVLGLPVEAPPVDDWLAPTPFEPGGHPLEAAGIRTDSDLRPVDARGNVALENVAVAGSVLAGMRYLGERCGDGVAIASGFRAAATLAGSGAWAARTAMPAGRQRLRSGAAAEARS